jgi:serine/threonine-protein kinase
MSLSTQLDALERACLERAPELLDHVRGIREATRELEGPGSAHTLALSQLDAPAEASATPTPSSPPPMERRYDDLGLIATGGMGDVRRVRDRQLNRVLAMKVVRGSLLSRPGAVARFVQEAQATAQLQHPAIVPVHHVGHMPDGRAFFTMKEVRGCTLTEAIRDAHAVPRPHRGVRLRRVVASLHRACEAVAYAHERGVVHRDLKPDNIMVGDHGEVLVMDWGLAKIRGRHTPMEDRGEAGATDSVTPGAGQAQHHSLVVTDRSLDDSAETRVGTVAGTPAYMAPEQARGELDRIDARTDVYALGAILYEVLTGRPAYEGADAREVWRQVLDGPPTPIHTRMSDAGDTSVSRDIAADLIDTCTRAMARSPEARFTSAFAFAAEIQSWLDGARRREQALEVVARAEATVPEAEALYARAETLRVEAEDLLAVVPSWSPEADKVAGWAKEAEADRLAREADLLTVHREQLLQGALSIARDLPEAHAALVTEYRGRHAAAERTRDGAGQATADVLIRRHAEALPADHGVRRSTEAYLSGEGALTLVTEPPGADVHLLSYDRHHRRLVEGPPHSLGHTPVRRVPLPMGSYLCVLRHPDHDDVRYPVHIARGAHWRGVRPGADESHPVVLPPRGLLGSDDLYVPAGWFLAGASDGYGAIPRTRLWCDGFAIRRFPVTNRQYIAFLDDLVDRGSEAEALRWAPREAPGQSGKQGALIYHRDHEGHFELVPDAQGDIWQPDWPVVMVDWHCARAYAAWEAERTCQPWRLPWDFEWEKAARGADGRRFPWGEAADASFACCRDSHREQRLPAAVDSFPLDTSPYGVRGLGGNVRDWCLDRWTRDGGLSADRVVRPVLGEGDGEGASWANRGGFWLSSVGSMRSAIRDVGTPTVRGAYLGFRLARPLFRDADGQTGS